MHSICRAQKLKRLAYRKSCIHYAHSIRRNRAYGSAVAETLLQKGEQVTIITHDPEKGARWKQKGAEVAIVEVEDTDALRKVFSKGGRLFLLNPPADPSTDTVKQERGTVASLLKALLH